MNYNIKDVILQAADQYLSELKTNPLTSIESQVNTINSYMSNIPYKHCAYLFKKHGGHNKHVLQNMIIKSQQVSTRYYALLLGEREMNSTYDMSSKYPNYKWRIENKLHWQLLPVKSNTIKPSGSIPIILPALNALTLGKTSEKPFVLEMAEEPKDDSLEFSFEFEALEFNIGEDNLDKFFGPQVIYNLNDAPELKFSKRLPTYYWVNDAEFVDAKLRELYGHQKSVTIDREIIKPICPLQYKKVGGRYNAIFPSYSPEDATLLNFKAVCDIYDSIRLTTG